jgi:hypothetical protein
MWLPKENIPKIINKPEIRKHCDHLELEYRASAATAAAAAISSTTGGASSASTSTSTSKRLEVWRITDYIYASTLHEPVP